MAILAGGVRPNFLFSAVHRFIDDEAGTSGGAGRAGKRKRDRSEQRGRSFTFTWNQNNDAEHDFLGVPTLSDFGEHATYLVYGHEVGESGNFHLQGYVHFDTSVSFAGVCAAVPGAHVEKAKGNAIQNRVYCTKDNNYVEEGVVPQQGRRNDLWDVKEIAKARRGLSLRSAVEEFPAIVAKYPKFVNTLNLVYGRERTTAPIVIYFYGPTGLGKSRSAQVIARHLGRVFRVPQAKGSGTYFDGYDGHEVMIFDEFYGNRVSWSSLLEITDRYANTLPVHGGAGPANIAEVIIFCSNRKPTELYKGIDPSPFLRRICWLQEFYVPKASAQQAESVRIPRETRANFFVAPFSAVTKFVLRACAPVDPIEREKDRLRQLAEEALRVDSDGKIRIRGG